MPEIEPSSLFDAYYFAHGCGEPYQRSDAWLALFNSFADRICKDIAPGSVLDAGCAMGFLVESLRQREVEAWGVDISNYAIDHVPQEIRSYCWQGSVIEPFPRSYDLIVCIEVLEHLPRDEGAQAVGNLCQHSDDILFSSTPFDYKEASHFNVQPPEYWAELFAGNGFYRDVDFDASFITSWAVRFRRKAEPVHRIVRDYERRFWTLWKENAELRSLAIEMRDGLARLEMESSEIIPAETGPLSEKKASGSGLRNWTNSILRRILGKPR